MVWYIRLKKIRRNIFQDTVFAANLQKRSPKEIQEIFKAAQSGINSVKEYLENEKKDKKLSLSKQSEKEQPTLEAKSYSHIKVGMKVEDL